MLSSHDCVSDLYSYSRLSLLSRTARVRRARLRIAYTPASLILTDASRKIVVVRAELASAIRAHPATAGTSTDLKRHTAIRACRRN